jgi:carbon monoxide dehydrogenase subunit G
MDLEKVAPAMPGAKVTDHVGDDQYKVAIKVKLGPMTMNYSGDVEIRDKDPEAHRAVMHVKAREARGQGTATADVTMSIEPEGSGSHATIAAEVQLAGKAAAMGRGLIEDVSAKLVDQFANNLSELLGGGATAERDAVPAEPPTTAASNGEAQAAADSEPAREAAASAEPEASAPAPPPSTPSGSAGGSGSPGGGSSGDNANGDDDVFDAGNLAASVAKDKLRQPQTVAAIVVAVLLLRWLLGRRG